VLDIDDTVDVVNSHQQLPLFNAHYDECCFLPIHVCDTTSCRAATANQMRLVLHTAAYWLVLAVRHAIPKAHALAKAAFTTIRRRLPKVAARFTETTSRCASPSQAPVQTPSSSATLQARSGPACPEPRGVRPLRTRSVSLTRSSSSSTRRREKHASQTADCVNAAANAQEESERS
jgi:hypothetical protein